MSDDLREDPVQSARRSGEQSGITLGRLLEGVEQLNTRLTETRSDIKALNDKVSDLANEATKMKTAISIFKWIIAPAIGILSLALAAISLGLMFYRTFGDK